MPNFDLIALSVVAAAMAVFVLVDDSSGGSAATTGRIVPEQRELDLLGFERRGRGQAVEVFGAAEDGAAGGAMVMLSPATAPLDATALADFEGTLELLSSRRIVAGGDSRERELRGLSPAKLELELRYSSGRQVVLQVGAYLPETDQYWLARRDRSELWLIDGYAGRVLLRGGDDLRSRRPLPTRHRDLTGIEISDGDRSLVLSGRPLELHLDDGGRVRLHADARRSIVSSIDDLRLSRFASIPDDAPPPAFVLRVLGGDGPRELVDRGACPEASGQRLVETPVGAGCVSEADLAELALTLDFREQLIDTHLVDPEAGKPVSISITRGDRTLGVESVGGGWRLSSGESADQHAVFEWARELDLLAAGVPRAVARKARVLATTTLTYAGGRSDRIELLVDGRIRRAGEPVAYPSAAGAQGVFDPGSPRFRERSVWSRDPSSIRRLAKRAPGRRLLVELTRGELLEDWSITASQGPSNHRLHLEELLETLSRLRARSYVAGKLGKVIVSIEVDRLDGTTTATDSLQIADGCRARRTSPGSSEAAVFVLTKADCALLLGPWTGDR